MSLDGIRNAFDPERFRTDGHRLIDRLADYLQRALAGRDAGGRAMPVLPAGRPDALVEEWQARLARAGTQDLSAIVARVLEQSNHLHHPRYVGHQVPPPLPVAALADLVGALLNNGMAVYEMGPAATAIERSVLRWMADRIGFPATADGVLTSGGSAGNLTALLAARQRKAGFDAWEEGAYGGPPLAILTSDAAHYSVARAARIMGLGSSGVFSAPVDERHRLRATALEDALARARAAGRRPFMVVASAGATATGAFDPLGEIADFCARHDLWLHVDGAHGASAALSPRLRGRLAGIERADSVVWDAHKLMLVPALVTAVLFRDGAASYESFAQDASYLFAASARAEEWYDVGTRTLECTKRMLGLKVYAALAVLGPDGLAACVERLFDLATAFARMIEAAPDFELAVEPECNIVCFRHVPAAVDDPVALDALQASLRARLIESGRFYLVQTRLGQSLWLRTALMNPLTEESDLEALLAEIRTAAVEFAAPE